MSAAAWLRAARPHPSGDTKPCAHCGHDIHRTSRVGPRDWSRRRYCSKSCASTAANQERAVATNGGDQLAALGQFVRRWGACRGSDADFVPDSKTEARVAIAVCTGCPVRAECLTYGLGTKSFGVWGGELLDPWKPRKTA